MPPAYTWEIITHILLLSSGDDSLPSFRGFALPGFQHRNISTRAPLQGASDSGVLVCLALILIFLLLEFALAHIGPALHGQLCEPGIETADPAPPGNVDCQVATSVMGLRG